MLSESMCSKPTQDKAGEFLTDIKQGGDNLFDGIKAKPRTMEAWKKHSEQEPQLELP